ncbi:MAG: hypothetical protein ACE5IY_18180 [bacterium]
MDAREETLEILKSKFTTRGAYKILDYFESRVRVDDATQKDIYELKLAIEKVRASLLKWNFGFWMTQMVALVTILFKLLS